MDSITQAALGAVVGEAILGRKLAWRGALWGAFFGTFPDLDVLVSPFIENEVTRLKWHRGISHSILLTVLMPLLFAKPLAWLHRERGLSARRAGLFVFLAWSTHVLIDVFTTYGTQVFEPFSDTRVSFNNLFIIDLFFSFPLLLCCALIAFSAVRLFLKRKDPQPRPWGTHFALPALALSSLYVAFSFTMKFWAWSSMKETIAQKLPEARIAAISATPFNTILWRGLLETEEAYHLLYWSPFDSAPAPIESLAKKHHLATPFADEELFQGLTWFSRDRWVARRDSDGAIKIIDIRFGEGRDLEKNLMYPSWQWILHRDGSGQLTRETNRPRLQSVEKSLELLWQRLRGDQSRWYQVRPF